MQPSEANELTNYACNHLNIMPQLFNKKRGIRVVEFSEKHIINVRRMCNGLVTYVGMLTSTYHT